MNNSLIKHGEWYREPTTGVLSFDLNERHWNYTYRPRPATGKWRPEHRPQDGSFVNAERPFPCPLGTYCITGVAVNTSAKKNFSTPQDCFKGFFCPSGSISPEGNGPCPTGYYCPTAIDAVICPQGHFCPGTGNVEPIICNPGSYNPLFGQSQCTLCPKAHICPDWGMYEPEICPAGYVCPDRGQSAPVSMCPAGYICNDGTVLSAVPTV